MFYRIHLNIVSHLHRAGKTETSTSFSSLKWMCIFQKNLCTPVSILPKSVVAMMYKMKGVFQLPLNHIH